MRRRDENPQNFFHVRPQNANQNVDLNRLIRSLETQLGGRVVDELKRIQMWAKVVRHFDPRDPFTLSSDDYNLIRNPKLRGILQNPSAIARMLGQNMPDTNIFHDDTAFRSSAQKNGFTNHFQTIATENRNIF